MKKLIEAILLLALFHPTSAFPAINAGDSGDKAGNGGDTCESRIVAIREDIQSWIRAGGSRNLVLPAGLSVNQYNREMRKKLSAAQVSCTEDLVKIGAMEKVCKNWMDSKGAARIVCNRRAFHDLAEEEQYVLVHHEYAGLAGFEESRQEESVYFLSRQLSAFLEATVMKRLSLKAQPPQKPNDIQKNFGDFVGQYRVVQCEERLNEERGQGHACDSQFAEIFFGDNYQPQEGGALLVLNLTNKLGTLAAGANIAYRENAPGTICSTFYGSQYCSNLGKGYVLNTGIRKEGNRFRLDWMLSWPNSRDNFLYHSLSLALEKLP